MKQAWDSLILLKCHGNIRICFAAYEMYFWNYWLTHLNISAVLRESVSSCFRAALQRATKAVPRGPCPTCAARHRHGGQLTLCFVSAFTRCIPQTCSHQLRLFSGGGMAVAPCADVLWADVRDTAREGLFGTGKNNGAQARTMGRPRQVAVWHEVWMDGLGDPPGLSAALPVFNCV